MVEVTLQIVLSLLGYKQLNWNTSKEFLGKPSIKVELMGAQPKALKPVDVLKAQQIFN